MRKYVGLAALAAVFVILVDVSISAAAPRYCPNGGYCPTGTCAQFNGVRYACNVKNCSAANCRR
jgi:hypothetical protein